MQWWVVDLALFVGGVIIDVAADTFGQARPDHAWAMHICEFSCS